MIQSEPLWDCSPSSSSAWLLPRSSLLLSPQRMPSLAALSLWAELRARVSLPGAPAVALGGLPQLQHVAGLTTNQV